MRGKPKDEIEAADRKVVLASVFRVHLVLRIITMTQDFLDREVILQAALSAGFGLALIGPDDDRFPSLARRKTEIRDALFTRVDELHALESARGAVEARYLGGAIALFPAELRAWERQRHDSERQGRDR